MWTIAKVFLTKLEKIQVWMKIQGLFDNYNKDDKGQFRGLVTKSNLYSIRLWVDIVQ